MVHFINNETSLQGVIDSIDATAAFWRVSPLPDKDWYFINGSLPEDSDYGNATVFTWKPMTQLGSISVRSFVYLMISVVVILVLIFLPSCRHVAHLILGNDRRFGTDRTNSRISAHAFDRRLREIYPREPEGNAMPSYPEQLFHQPGRDVSAGDVRECQSMLRQIYGLKINAFNARDVRRGNQEIVTGWKTQATSGLKDLKEIVDRWGQNTNWSARERTKVEEIRRRILAIRPDA
jgi:hypothetical protein